ncbi:hypothetical protein [Enterococcus durans]|uniref:hypothetical protein n=1 Tax=Enterococcus durans TaxID=53345 RepID=UPI002804C307|nr:hypothetical protein [Enterococcus durans]
MTGIAYTEDFSLWLSQTENSYFVNTLKHYFTEKGRKLNYERLQFRKFYEFRFYNIVKFCSDLVDL